ncbi:MAG TPA: hypothetical protein VF695_07645 [Sphingomonas sp.]|jgi:FtsZ-interacting cell division protein ZipA
MADYRTDTDRTDRRSGGAGRTIAILLLVAGLIVAALFFTGFWSANVTEGSLPKVDISTKGGEMPKVDVDSKELVVGTKETTVDVPKVTTEKETVSVPAVGVKDNGEK